MTQPTATFNTDIVLLLQSGNVEGVNRHKTYLRAAPCGVFRSSQATRTRR